MGEMTRTAGEDIKSLTLEELKERLDRMGE